MLRSYIESLHRHVEQVNKEKELAKQRETASLQTMQPLVKPLELQIIEFFRSLPSAQTSRPWSLRDITLRLEGKYRAHPHPQQVGETLRKLGWQRRRVYGAQGGGRRYWFPPA